MLVEKHQNAHLVCGHLKKKWSKQKNQTIDDVSLMLQSTDLYKNFSKYLRDFHILWISQGSRNWAAVHSIHA